MDISAIACIKGPRLTLRLITPEDAAYVHGLRTNSAYNSHLSTVTGSVADQRQWIEDYKARGAAGQEFYYVITRNDGTACGLVRLYEIVADSFTWGSWILDANKPRKAALESAVLIYDVGFGGLRCSQAVFDVRSDNANTLAFHRRFGAIETHRTAQDIFFVYPRARFTADRPHYLTLLSEKLKHD